MSLLGNVLDYQVEPIKNIMENAKHANKRQIVFFGDSLMQGYDVDTYFPNKQIYNCGVNGATTDLLLHLHDEAIKPYDPSKVVILIGTNDLGDSYQYDKLDIVFNIYNLIQIMNIKYDIDNIYVISPLPIMEGLKKGICKDNTQLRILGNEMQGSVEEFENCKYLDVFAEFLDDTQQMKKEYTTDGLHLSEKGYEKLTQLLEPSINEE